MHKKKNLHIRLFGTCRERSQVDRAGLAQHLPLRACTERSRSGEGRARVTPPSPLERAGERSPIQKIIHISFHTPFYPQNLHLQKFQGRTNIQRSTHSVSYLKRNLYHSHVAVCHSTKSVLS